MVQEMIEVQTGLPIDRPLPDAGLETALAQLDGRLAAAQKALTAAQRQLKQVTEASRQGNLRDLPKLLAGAAETAGVFVRATVDASRSWAFDGQSQLDTGSYMAELIRAAEAGGLAGVREVDGQLYSFPVVVKVDARDLSLKVGKKTQRGLRPSAVVALLKRLRSQPAKDNLRPLLTAFESFSVMCSETTLCLLAMSTDLSLGLAGPEDAVLSVSDLPADAGPTEPGSQIPMLAAEPIESQTIREHTVRFITHEPFPCQNNPLFAALMRRRLHPSSI